MGERELEPNQAATAAAAAAQQQRDRRPCGGEPIDILLALRLVVAQRASTDSSLIFKRLFNALTMP